MGSRLNTAEENRERLADFGICNSLRKCRNYRASNFSMGEEPRPTSRL